MSITVIWDTVKSQYHLVVTSEMVRLVLMKSYVKGTLSVLFYLVIGWHDHHQLG